MVRRVALGAQSDGSYGLRCSQPGYDAYSNPVDDTRLSFNSAWNTVMPIYLAGASLNIANNTTPTISFSSLGYIPLGYFMIRRNGNSGWNSLPPLMYAGSSNTVFVVNTYIDHIKVTNKLGFSIDLAYVLFYAVTQ